MSLDVEQMIESKIHHSIIESTNDEAKRLLQLGYPEGTVVWADQQTAGRGRQGRRWISKPGNMFASVIVKPKVSPEIIGQLSFVAGLAAHQALSHYLGNYGTLRLKWPNDVLVNNCKIAGILIETDFAGSALNGVVIGVGINLVNAPERVAFPAIALCELMDRCILPSDMLDQFLIEFAQVYELWLTQKFPPIRDRWMSHAHGLGDYITVACDGDTTEGYFKDLSPSGELILQMMDDTLIRFNAAEIVPSDHSINVV
jgi:BirA family transcriptional regulator, biotin operon repressor / biotin---[acetyl-CoA-carboxylase] ligase